MKRTLVARHVGFPLHTPFRISRGMKEVADTIQVTITEGGHMGRGEGIPYPRYGETVENVLAAIAGIAARIEDGADREALQTLLPAGAARNAVDCALWDLAAKRAGRPVFALAGLPPPAAVPTALTIGLDRPDDMARAAGRLADVPLLKVKVDASAPDAQIRAVRAAAPRPKMIVDPNESWTAPLLAEIGPLLAELSVDLLEQPLPAGEDEALEGMACPVPVAADEALHTLADLPQVARRYRVANIKLDKTGGLTEALRLRQECRTLGLGLMVGCMVSSSLSIAPAMLLTQGADFVDLDGPLWLADDLAGGVRAEAGMLMPPDSRFWGAP